MTIALTLPHEGETFTAAGCTFRILDDGGPTAVSTPPMSSRSWRATPPIPTGNSGSCLICFCL